jgi:hypothetical protein
VKTYRIHYSQAHAKLAGSTFKDVQADYYTVNAGRHNFYINDGDVPIVSIASFLVDSVELVPEPTKSNETKYGLGEAKFETTTKYGLFNVLVGTRQVIDPEDTWLFDTPFMILENRWAALDYYREHHTKAGEIADKRVPTVREVKGKQSYFATVELREQITEMHVFPWQNA